ncbi:hypothetical protein PPIS_a2069 [Pseudoalteromonas piscicida]|uniref:Uncharacterized protein n=1 Tax=Pseudoalteromonas piscicida TaxID=43662 RepID=A0ABN5CIY2_PSEO7|nr:hypothetical protein PPIS_a2069 [Pseudoalteromonas piscicida]
MARISHSWIFQVTYVLKSHTLTDNLLKLINKVSLNVAITFLLDK